MAAPKAGTVVNFNTGGADQKGVVVGHQGDKALVIPIDNLASVGYREPADRDENGAGGTYWKA